MTSEDKKASIKVFKSAKQECVRLNAEVKRRASNHSFKEIKYSNKVRQENI